MDSSFGQGLPPVGARSFNLYLSWGRRPCLISVTSVRAGMWYSSTFSAISQSGKSAPQQWPLGVFILILLAMNHSSLSFVIDRLTTLYMQGHDFVHFF